MTKEKAIEFSYSDLVQINKEYTLIKSIQSSHKHTNPVHYDVFYVTLRFFLMYALMCVVRWMEGEEGGGEFGCYSSCVWCRPWTEVSCGQRHSMVMTTKIYTQES